MSSSIRRAAVIGAGTMGAAIAAHLVNAGIPTLLLDVAGSDPADRNAPAKAGLERARKARPAAFMDLDPSSVEKLLTLGNISDDLQKLSEVDWVVEAIIEKPEAKKALWEKVEASAGAHTIFSSNSSGIPMSVQSEGRSQSFKERFLGAHFYNPPRWLYLLELIPTLHTNSKVLETLRAFGDQTLGKGIVIANDVPGFIGNRIGIYSILQAMRTMEELNLSIEEVDMLTGPILGRPKSATLRTADAVGLDVLAFISEDLTKATHEDYSLPHSLKALLERKYLGDKTGSGYYKKTKNADTGSSKILTLNLKTFAYENRTNNALSQSTLESIQKLKSPIERTKALLNLEGVLGDFSRHTIFEMLHFAFEKYGIVANSYEAIDQAMRWGFGWELGPFELADALGHKEVAEGFKQLHKSIPITLQKHLDSETLFYPKSSSTSSQDCASHIINLGTFKNSSSIVYSNASANLIDLKDGVLLLEFTSKANAVNQGTYETAIKAIELVQKNFAGLLISNQGKWFSAGADLQALLKNARANKRSEVESMINGFQQMTLSLRNAPFPVVSAPFSMTLGGGCEVTLYSDHVQAYAELNIGLVELKVGLMPSAGGTTEMLFRKTAKWTQSNSSSDGKHQSDLLRAVEETFNLITSTQVSSSAIEARQLNFLRATDGITMNKHRLLFDAKNAVLKLHHQSGGYKPALARSIEVLGEVAYNHLMGIIQERFAHGEASPYDIHLASDLARILSGGGVECKGGIVPEEQLLKLEREVFVELVFREQTQARIEHMLKTGKPLRN